MHKIESIYYENGIKRKIWNITEDWVKYNLKVLVKKKGVIMRVGPDNWGYWEIVDEI